MKEITLYGIGHAMVDYYAVLQSCKTLPFSLKLGEANHVDTDEIFVVLDELKKHSKLTRVAGGTCANILRLCSKNGASAVFSGTVGSSNSMRDKDSYFFQEECARSGLNAYLKSEDGTTGRCLIVHTENESKKAILACPSIARSITKEQVLENEIAKADCIVLEGMLFFNTEVIDQTLELILKHNKILALDVASSFCSVNAIKVLCSFINENPLFAKNVFIFANENEFSNVTCNAKNELESLLAQGSIIVEKRGAEGAKLYTKENILLAKAESLVPLDDTGAGDAFAAGFLLEYLSTKNKENLSKSLVEGNTFAANVLTSFGCS